MKSERIAELMARKAGLSASREELEELEQLLAADPDARFVAAVIQAVGNNHPEDVVEEQGFAVTGWEQLETRLQPALTPVSHKRYWWWAAAVLFLLATGAGWKELHSNRVQQMAAIKQRITAPFGKTIKTLLPDGSNVWLNAGSELSYDANFGRSSRNITVTGEIFLDVVKDDARPFIVHTSNLAVHVLGTSFNIKAYDDDTRSEIAVIGGKVQVIMRNNPEKKIILLPNEKLVLSVTPASSPQKNIPQHANFQVEGLLNSKDSNLVLETAWRDQKLAFMNETFEDVTRKMERQFNVTITFEDADMKKEILSGVFEKEDIGKALHLLQMITTFHYRVDQQHVYLSK